MRHIIPISGKDSLATAIWQTAHEPNLPYVYIYNDTRAELPETYAWLDRVESALGIKIERIGKSLEQVIDQHGILPSPRIRFCTRDSKIRPMDRFIGKDVATVYFGLRADEPERVGAFESKKLKPRYPLREAGIGLAIVYKLVETKGLMPPAFFWERLRSEVERQLFHNAKSTIDAWPHWMRQRIFAWRSRPNCFFCFFQRRYEWVGLLEHHPELFEKAEEIERRIGNGPNCRREGGVFWIDRDYPLSKIRERKDFIFQSRVDAVCKLVNAARQTQLFEDTIDGMDAAATSCGLLCGK